MPVVILVSGLVSALSVVWVQLEPKGQFSRTAHEYLHQRKMIRFTSNGAYVQEIGLRNKSRSHASFQGHMHHFINERSTSLVHSIAGTRDRSM